MGFLKTEQCSVSKETMYTFLKLPLTSWMHAYAGCVIITTPIFRCFNSVLLRIFQFARSNPAWCKGMLSFLSHKFKRFGCLLSDTQSTDVCIHVKEGICCVKSNNITYVFVAWGTLKVNDNCVFPRRGLIELTVHLAKLAVSGQEDYCWTKIDNSFLQCDSSEIHCHVKLISNCTHSMTYLPVTYWRKINSASRFMIVWCCAMRSVVLERHGPQLGIWTWTTLGLVLRSCMKRQVVPGEREVERVLW